MLSASLATRGYPGVYHVAYVLAVLFAEAARAHQDLVIAELGHRVEKRAPSPCVRTGAAGHAHEFVRSVEGAFS
jgi:hypothetical protein